MDVLALPAGNPSPLTGQGNNTWLLRGAEPALVDAGVGVATHLDAISEALAGASLTRVLVTHGHADHASGVPALRKRWPGMEAWKYPVDDERDWRPLFDGQRIRAGDATLTVIHTPGHARDHVCFWHAETRELFSGDMIAIGTTVMIPAGRGGGMRAYLASLERLAGLAPARVFPGHGPVIDRPVELIQQYIEHRQMRDVQVRECLAAGIEDSGEIVGRIYPGLAVELTAAARATIEAHIEMIRDGGL